MLLHGSRCECSGRIYRVGYRGVSLPGLLPADEPAYLKPDITPKEIHGNKYYCVCIGHKLLFKDYFFSVDFCGLVFEAAAAGGFPALTKVNGIATEQSGDVGTDDGFIVMGVAVVDLQRRYGGVPLLPEHGGGEDAPGLDLLNVVPGDRKGDVDFHSEALLFCQLLLDWYFVCNSVDGDIATKPKILSMAKKVSIRTLYRRADNGAFCTKKYAESHPKTTVKETRKTTK